MLFPVELDHVKSGVMMTAETWRAFVDGVILPTLARAEELMAQKTILAGGAVRGRIALRFIVEAGSLPEVDRIVSSLPLWPLAESRVAPLVSASDRRASVEALIGKLAG